MTLQQLHYAITIAENGTKTIGTIFLWIKQNLRPFYRFGAVMFFVKVKIRGGINGNSFYAALSHLPIISSAMKINALK